MKVDLRTELAGVLLAVLVVGGLGALAGGVGFQNGDAAAYLVQAQHGDLTQRTTHLGYLALASWIAPHTGDLALALDRISAAACAIAVIAGAWSCREGSGRPAIAALAVGAAILPISGFAEVDPLWLVLVLCSRVGPIWMAVPSFALAVTVSPVALLAGPWASWGSRDRAKAIALAAAIAIAGLTLVSGGDWWFGDRGVLAGAVLRPGRVIREWAVVLPWALLPLALISDRGGESEVVSWLPLLLAPPDVPAWVLCGWSLALRAASGARLVPGGFAEILVAIQLVIGGFGLWDLRDRIARDREIAETVAADLGPDEGLIAPFTWGARVSVAATGDPYGLTWRPPERFLREQAVVWCERRFERVLLLPEQHWLAGDDPMVRAGCER